MGNPQTATVSVDTNRPMYPTATIWAEKSGKQKADHSQEIKSQSPFFFRAMKCST